MTKKREMEFPPEETDNSIGKEMIEEWKSFYADLRRSNEDEQFVLWVFFENIA